MQPERHKKYSDAFRKKALDMVAAGTPVTKVAAKMGVHNSLLYIWRAKAEGRAPPPSRRRKVAPFSAASGPEDKWAKVKQAVVFLKGALDEWGTPKSKHLASVAYFELKEVI